MKYLLPLLLLCACKGTDATPDEFHVIYGQANGDGHDSNRSTNDFVESASVGLTWHIGDVARREREDEYLAAIQAVAERPQPAPVVVSPVIVHDHPVQEAPQGEPRPLPEEAEPTSGEDPTIWQKLIPLVPGILLAFAGLIFKEKHS